MSDENQKDNDDCTAEHKIFEFQHTGDEDGDMTFQAEYCPDHKMIQFSPIIVHVDGLNSLIQTLQKFATYLLTEGKQIH